MHNFYMPDAAKDVDSRLNMVLLCIAFSMMGAMLSIIPTIITIIIGHDLLSWDIVRDLRWVIVGFWATAGVYFGCKFARHNLEKRRKELRQCSRLRCPVCGSENILFNAAAKFNPHSQSFIVSDVNWNVPHYCKGCTNEIMVEVVDMYPELNND